MPLFDPQLLASESGGSWTKTPDRPICGFSADTRQLKAGEAFVALKTEKRDGRDFLGAAAAAGASAALVSAADPRSNIPQLVVADPLAAFQAIARANRRRFKGPVVGISGSAGKTSTKELLALLLGGTGEGRVLATEANLNNHIGVPLTLTRLDPAFHRFAVVEAGIGAAGEMPPLALMIEPDVAIITLIAPAHLEHLRDLEGVAREKVALPAAARPGGIAIYPPSCGRFAAFRDLSVPSVTVERTGCGSPPAPAGVHTDRMIFSVEHRGDETLLHVAGGAAGGEPFVLRRVTDGMAHNAALALCAALRLGIEPRLIRERLRTWQPAPMRGEVRREDGRLLYLDCYNANPAAMEDALAAFRAIAPEEMPRLVVLGCMEELGAGSAKFHRELGRSVGLRPDDQLFAVGERAADIAAGAREGGASEEQVHVAGEASELSGRVAQFRGAIFVKGSRRWQLERVAHAGGAVPH